MKSICNVNRTGKVSSSPVSPGGDSPYDPAAPEYSGYAFFMSGTGALLDADQISDVQAVNDVYVLFGQPVTGTSVVTYSITHVGVVLNASAPIEETPDARKVTIKFTPSLKVGQGQRSSYFSSSHRRSWNAKVLPIAQMLSSQVVFRPAYDYAVSDEAGVTTPAQWSISSPEPHTGAFNVVRNVPADAPDASKSDIYNVITFDLFYTIKSVIVRPEPGNLMCGTLTSINENDKELSSHADFTAPAAIVEATDKSDLYWLAWHKPSGMSTCAICLLRSTADAVPRDTVAAASPVMTVFWAAGLV